MKLSKETKVGMLTVVAAFCIVWGYNYIKGKNLFSNEKIYVVYYDNVSGLNVTDAVVINGLNIGRVSGLELQPDRSIKAVLMVPNTIEIPANTVAKIQNLGILGSSVVNLILGNSTEAAENNAVLQGEREPTFAESMEPLKAKMLEMISHADSIVVAFNSILTPEFQKNIGSAMKNLEVASKEFSEGIQKLDVVMDNVESITQNLKGNNDHINTIVQNIEHVTDQAAKVNIQETFTNANNAIAEVQNIIAKINKGEGSMGLLINNDQLYNNLNHSAAALDSLLTDIKKHPRRYLQFSVFGGKEKHKESNKSK